MRKIVMGTALALGFVGAAAAQDGPIEGVIQGQIDAFLADDMAAAFGYASPAIKGVFGSPERFGDMVVNGYPMVHRPSEVRYLERREFGDGVIQKVLVRDSDGVPWVLDYQMVEGPDGWVINGVQVLRAPEYGA